ncbi:MAG: hypothetical protein AUK47_20080 [Deltaproteobacteria bacterium CG2_30_63_29]|nr:MAG: hypothetical protein AUK47_20080 [Deltaproteobacteria bacterium CG2_30_63_29]
MLAILMVVVACMGAWRSRPPLGSRRSCDLGWRSGALICSEDTEDGSTTAFPNDVALALGAPLDLNRADADELLQINGLGPRRVEAILALRFERGGFCSVDELQDVKGIGPKTVARLREVLRVSGPDDRRCGDALGASPRRGRLQK